MFYSRDVKFYETIFPYKMSLEKDKCLVKDSFELKEFSQNDDLTSHKTFFDDFQTDGQASIPNNDGGEPSGSNIGSEFESDDTAREQSSNNDQGSMQIGDEDFSRGNVRIEKTKRSKNDQKPTRNGKKTKSQEQDKESSQKSQPDQPDTVNLSQR
ncbi:hypothetical protein Tco_0328329 [Tanacetum coccineum]